MSYVKWRIRGHKPHDVRAILLLEHLRTVISQRLVQYLVANLAYHRGTLLAFEVEQAAEDAMASLAIRMA